MSINSQNNDNQEIDLSQISRKIGDFFEGISTKIFRAILFFKRNIVWVGILFVLGAGLGLYLDKTAKVYDHQIIVQPNFGSNEYLYSKINLLNSKNKEGDSLYLKALGFRDVEKLDLIKVEPIIDIYKFIDNSAENFELIKLMAEDGDLDKIIKDELTSKNYPFHSLNIRTSRKVTDEDLVKPLLDYLNNSDYYKVIQKEYLNNIKIKVRENDSIINQINGFLDNFKRTGASGIKSSSLVYYNDNMQLNEIIKTKDALIAEQGTHRLEVVNYDKIVKEISVVTNIQNTKGANNKRKLILPLLFISIFIFIKIFKSFIKRQLAKSKI